jgi:HK97 gp10 family phage protein
MSQVRVKGLSELNKFLQELPVKMEANIMRGALRAGLKPIKEAAVQNCPVGEPSENNKRKYKVYAGALRDSIRVSARIDKKEGKVVARLVAGGKGKNGASVFYAHIIEMTGARAHSLSKKEGGEINHPGMQARPFLRPALDAQANNAVLAAGQYIKQRLATKNGINTADIELGIE